MTDPIVPSEIHPAPEVELTAEEIEALNPTNLPPPPENETPEEKEERLAALQASNEKLWGWNQRLRKKPATPAPAAPAASVPTVPAPTDPATPGLSREEGILFSQGFTEAQVEQAKKVATLQNLKLTDAVNDPLFTTWKAIEDKKAKDLLAQLPPSRGGRTTVKKTLNTPGLSPEEHQELFREKYAK